MNSTKFLIFLLAVITISACRKDIDGEVESITIEPNIPILHDSGLGGLVINENGEAVESAAITYLDYETTTDENGYFYFQNVPINENGNLLKITKDGFFDGFRFYYPTDSNDSYSKTMLIQKQSVGNFSASTGGEVSFGSVNLTFPPNAIKYESSGNAYDGTVDVLAHYYDPTGANLGMTMPGDLSGVDATSLAVQLATYGMMAVELVSSDGEKLNLNTDSKAVMSMGVPDLLESNAPGVIPLWSLDEVSGFWKEDGSALLLDGRYVGEISHFSFWNCDAPFPLIRLKGRIVGPGNLQLANTSICLTVVSNSAITRSGFTDLRGMFNGKVPKGEALLMQVKDDCGEIIHEVTLPPMQEDTDLGDIIITSNELSQVSGRIVCNGTPIINGYVIIKEFSTNQFYTIKTDQDGVFNYLRIYCEEGEVEITGYDLDNLTSSETPIIVVVSNSSNEDVGDIESCDEQLDEWFNYAIDGGDEYQMPNVASSIDLDSFRMSGNGANNFFNLRFKDSDPSQTLSPEYFQLNSPDGYVFCNSGCNSMEFNFSTIDNFTGGYVEGTFSGLMEQQGGQIPVAGDFRIQLDEYIPKAWVEGIAWTDTNANGIQEQDETGASDIFISAEVTGSGNVRTAQTNGNGEFRIAVEAEQQITLSAQLPIGFLSPMDQGDDLLDSDFDPSTNSMIIAPITEGETVENIGVGVLEFSDDLECFSVVPDTPICIGSSTFLNIQVLNNGVPPYSYVWSDGSTDSMLEIFESGTYFVTVTDSNSSYCEHVIDFYEFMDVVPAELELTNTECGATSGGTASILNAQNFGSITWSNGETGEAVFDLEPGNYSVNYIDFNGCDGFTTFEILQDEAKIGNQVWVDRPGGTENHFDGGDLTLEGVVVNLWEVSSNSIVETQTTDANGSYLFGGQYEGEYFVEFELPDGYEFVLQADISEIDDGTKSKVDPATGYSFIYEIICGEVNLTIDAGLKEL